MIDFFNNIYTYTAKSENSLLSKIKFYSILRLLIRVSSNIVLPIYFRLTSNNINYMLPPKDTFDNDLIVTLTSFPARINRLWIVIETVLRQTYKPDSIILWLSTEQFSDMNQVPKSLLRLKKRGLKIELVEGDIRSHKKYYYALKKYPNSKLITVDDDIIYPTDSIEHLIHMNRKFPDSIIARYGYKIISCDGDLLPYNKWEKYNISSQPSTDAFFGSGGGTLFPVGSLPSVSTKKEVFIDICPLADDVWLNSVIRYNNRDVFILDDNLSLLLPVINYKDVTLSSQNLGENLNDEQIKNVRNFFIEKYDIDPFRDVLNQ